MESGHWYDKTGKLILEVPRADGKGMKPPTLREARKNLWLPSTTTILQLLSRPGLVTWKMQQVVDACLHHTRGGGTVEEYSKRMIEASEEKVMLAADFGTQVHKGIYQGFTEQRLDIDELPAEVVRGFWPWWEQQSFDCYKSEHSFVSPLGWAGTIDMVGTYEGDPCIVDFKTQEFTSEKGVNWYDEHPLQLAGYASGSRDFIGQDVRRFSVVLSRNVPGLVVKKEWEESRRWDAAFLTLWDLWKLLKKYDPLQEN